MSNFSFAISSLSREQLHLMKITKVWTETCPLSYTRLKLLRIAYYDFAEKVHDDGNLVVVDAAVEQVKEIFQELFDLRFPIAKINLPEVYAGNDLLSMADNSTSCFCHRPIEGTNLDSLHSYGLAIDLNPVQNPFVQFNEIAGEINLEPKSSWRFLNRHNLKEGMAEKVVSIFAKHGFFIWGGRWTTPIDFQHFQTARGVAELVAYMSQKHATTFFNQLCKCYREKMNSEESNQISDFDKVVPVPMTEFINFPHGKGLDKAKEIYDHSPSQFFSSFKKLFGFDS